SCLYRTGGPRRPCAFLARSYRERLPRSAELACVDFGPSDRPAERGLNDRGEYARKCRWAARPVPRGRERWWTMGSAAALHLGQWAGAARGTAPWQAPERTEDARWGATPRPGRTRPFPRTPWVSGSVSTRCGRCCVAPRRGIGPQPPRWSTCWARGSMAWPST